MHRGYVKLWRKSVDSCVMQNCELWRFWCWCLLKASHKNCKVMVGFQEVALDAGQFVFGRHKAALALKMSEQTVRSSLKSLKSNQQITIKVTNKFSVISIINWHLYQSDDDKDNQQNDQQSNQQLTSKQPASNQQATTNKHLKHLKETTIPPSPPLQGEPVQETLFMECKPQNNGVPYEEIRKLYNDMLCELPNCIAMTEARKRNIRTCWKSQPGRTDTMDF